jgi:hypothetical protein
MIWQWLSRSLGTFSGNGLKLNATLFNRSIDLVAQP